MKLRFRQNSLRLRLNRREVERLTAGRALSERIYFPGDTHFDYVLESVPLAFPRVEFQAGTVQVALPASEIAHWAGSDAIGIYFEVPANVSLLKVAIEKDLECIDGPAEERDPDAYSRSGKNC
jgi:hypothetical protein